MNPLDLITSNPQWVALAVALGGLAFQQWQIRGYIKALHSCYDEMRASLEVRLDRHWVRIEKLSDEILSKTDIR